LEQALSTDYPQVKLELKMLAELLTGASLNGFQLAITKVQRIFKRRRRSWNLNRSF
jgi:hypothetical protein